MKIYYFLISILLLNSCMTTPNQRSLEPLWYSDSFSYLSEDKNIVFKAKANTFEDAEDQIFNDSEYLSTYLVPEKVKEYVNDNGDYYLLYSIKKSELKNIMKEKSDLILLDVSDFVSKGDKTSNILEKYSLYTNAIKTLESFTKLKTFAKNQDIVLNNTTEYTVDEIVKKINFTKDEIVFNVNINGDIDGILESAIKHELHLLGYETSSDGSIILKAELVLKDVDLNNNYLNKFWSVTVELQDFYGDSINSLTFRGRESQLTEESLNQLIIQIISNKIKDSLREIIP